MQTYNEIIKSLEEVFTKLDALYIEKQHKNGEVKWVIQKT